MTFEIYQHSFLSDNEITINLITKNGFNNVTKFPVSYKFDVTVENLKNIIIKQINSIPLNSIPFWIWIDKTEALKLIQQMSTENSIIFDSIPCDW